MNGVKLKELVDEVLKITLKLYWSGVNEYEKYKN